MKIAVIGAGIAGITCAYEFARDGHVVSVFEQASAAAVASSFANTGILSTSLTPHLSHPAWPNTKLLGQTGTPSHISLGRHVRLRDLRWLQKWKSKRSPEVFLDNLSNALHLTQFSQQHLSAIAADTKIEFERTDGQLLLIGSASELDSMSEKLAFLKNQGVIARQLSAEDVTKVEPAFKATSPLHCAIHFPGDSVGNCRQFALAAKKELQHMGVDFNFNAGLSGIGLNPGPSLHFHEGTVQKDYDHVVLCTGTGAQSLLNALHIRLPMAIIASYSLTARIREGLNAPKGAIHDRGSLTTIVRLGNRVRVSCGAELGSASEKHDAKTVQHLYHALQQSFPGAADYSSGVQVWKGTFGVMHDGLPVIGQSVLPGIWLNVGHGPNGWGMACGAARCIADAVCKRTSPISLDKFSPLRFL
jgi:D-amino-acid dehydrogenase